MQNRLVLAFGSLLTMGLSLPATTSGAQAQNPTPTPEARIQDTLARYQTWSRPGPEHGWLSPLEGEFRVEVTWLSLGGEKLVAAGNCHNRFILGGRFLEARFESGEGDSRLEGLILYGYDSRKRQFFALSLDNLSTRFLQPWGTFDPVTRSLILSGKDRDEVTGAPLGYRLLLKIESADRHHVQVFIDVPSGPPVKILEAAFDRVR